MLKDVFARYSGNLQNLMENIAAGVDTSVFNLSFGERTHIAAMSAEQRFSVFVTGDIVTARKAYGQMVCLLGESSVAFLPPKEDVLTLSSAQSQDNISERIDGLYRLAAGKCKILVTSAEALTAKYPRPDIFRQNIISYRQGRDYSLSLQQKKLAMAGYRREALVGAAGQFSVRGDILDVFPVNRQKPLRLSFFGDSLESIREFDCDSQKSGDFLEAAEISPATTLFLNKEMAEAAVRRLRKDIARNPAVKDRARNILENAAVRLESGDRQPGIGFLEPFIDDAVPLACYMPEDSAVFFDDCKQITDTVRGAVKEHGVRFKALLSAGEITAGFAEAVYGEKEAFDFDIVKVGFHRLTSANNIFQPKAVLSFSGFVLPKYSHNHEVLAQDLISWTRSGYRIFLMCGSDERAEHMFEVLQNLSVSCSIMSSRHQDAGVYLTNLILNYGFVHHDIKVVCLGANEISGKRGGKISARTGKDVFHEISPGDYVVHFVHGVGRFLGAERIEGRDYLAIVYKNEDKLYVPAENMDSVTKFSGSDRVPPLNKLGGTEFAKVKDKVRGSVKKLAFDLLELYAKREQIRPKKVSVDNELAREFAQSFPYEETDDQLAAIEDVKSDFERGIMMDRLLCGDVGYGKTEVALRAVFMVAAGGQQAAILAPTTILAEQHHNTAKSRFEGFGLRVECLSRFRSAAEVTNILSDLKAGKVDVIIGTHRILSKDVEFFDLGLLILDEEQRFGVADKEKIKLIKNNVHVLTLTATPIPRTLHMSMSGIRDISVLDTPPADRIPVQTIVTEYSEALVKDAVMRELMRGGQAFIVYNRVEKIELFCAGLKKFLPDVRFVIAHGQMNEGELEKAIASFYDGEADVLLCSTIIENGIDLPMANTMIVCDAENLGLSQLYQLKGRVGRSNRVSYVYFTYETDKLLTENAYKRLEAITEFTEFGSGFKIAMRDLEIRGAGNVLGREQHGHMEKVGYEMYLKLLGDAVELLKEGKDALEYKETRVETDLKAFIPVAYVEDERSRMRLFQRVSHISSIVERDELLNDITELYGAPPQEVVNLLLAGLIKSLASRIRAERAVVRSRLCALRFERLSDLSERVMDTVSEFAGRCVLKIDKMPIIAFEGKNAQEDLIKFLAVFDTKRDKK